MADALKDMFNKAFYQRLADELHKADKRFAIDGFVKNVTSGLESLSLNERLRNTSVVMKNYLPSDYSKSLDILYEVVSAFKGTYTALVFPDYVGQYGHDDFNLSMEALKYFTRFGSSEFAIRQYLKRDFSKTLKVMQKWADDKNHHVRRLASEGSRSRLPWSFNLDEVFKNPEVTRPILEKLKADEELYVKKSVANHLNDFSKNHSFYLLQVMNEWDRTNPHTAWIIKHAGRTLIKKGNQESLAVFNFEKNVKVEVSNFKLNKSKLKLGESLHFEFDLISHKSTNQKLVIDYAIGFVKKSGEVSPKIFKLKEIELSPKQSVHVSKTQPFVNLSTRTHFKGNHFVEIVINGKSYIKQEFMLIL